MSLENGKSHNSVNIARGLLVAAAQKLRWLSSDLGSANRDWLRLLRTYNFTRFDEMSLSISSGVITTRCSTGHHT